MKMKIKGKNGATMFAGMFMGFIMRAFTYISLGDFGLTNY